MIAKGYKILGVLILGLFSGLLATADHAFATDQENALYSFCAASVCADGAVPYAPVVLGSDGSLYGTTYEGGGKGCFGLGCGSVFRLMRNASASNGMWTEQVLHGFPADSSDGVLPEGGVILDTAGNLYGTTSGGGLSGPSICQLQGCGIVFELTPSLGGEWTEKVLYSFCAQSNCTDGARPVANLTFDAVGNLYGTTSSGGAGSGCDGYGCGTVFELSPGPNGSWTHKVLHNFGYLKGGNNPQAGLVFDAAGNIYGTTIGGGATGDGVVFELSPGPNNSWNEQLLYSFSGPDGRSPSGDLIIDPVGNLYGTTMQGGVATGCTYGCGTVFTLTPGANHVWSEAVLYSFCAATDCTDGDFPFGGVISDELGNLWGTTNLGGEFPVGGTIFKLTHADNGSWTETVVYDFGSGPSGDGLSPRAGLTIDRAGNLYGTTTGGGRFDDCPPDSGCGTVFQLSTNPNYMRRFVTATAPSSKRLPQ